MKEEVLSLSLKWIKETQLLPAKHKLFMSLFVAEPLLHIIPMSVGVTYVTVAARDPAGDQCHYQMG